MKARAGGIFGGGGGFTLLEVLIAMVVFFSAVAFFSMAYLNTLSAVSSVQVNQSLEQDLALARQQALVIADPEELEAGGEILTGEHGLALWRADYAPTEIADLFKVTLSVELEPKVEEGGQGGQRLSVSQELYLVRPSWSDATEREELRSRSRERFESRQAGLGR